MKKIKINYGLLHISTSMFQNFKLSKSKIDLTLVYIAQSLRYLYLLLLIPFYARVLGVDGYAVVLAAMSLMQMVWFFVKWGLEWAGAREIATANKSEYATIFSHYTSARLITTFFAIIFGLIAVEYSSLLANHKLAGVIAVFVGVASAFNLGWFFTGTGRPRHAVLLDIIGFALNLVLIFSFVHGASDAWIVLATLLISAVFALLLAISWVKAEVSPFKLDFIKGMKLISTSFPMFLQVASVMIVGSASTYLLSIFAPQSEVGYYGSAERLVTAGLSLMGPIGMVFAPKVIRLFKESEHEAYALVRKILWVLMLIAMAGFTVSELAAEIIVMIVFGSDFAASVEVLRWLAVLFPIHALTNVLGAYVLIPLHKDVLYTKITLWTSLITILISIPFSIYFHGSGMAIARVIGGFIGLLILIFYFQRLGLLNKLTRANNPH